MPEFVNSSIQTYEQGLLWGVMSIGSERLTYASMIDDNLWMGACPPSIGPPVEFRTILDMYDWERYRVPEGTERRTHQMHDGKDLPSNEVLFELADWINERRKVGPVLVHCQAGLNRSGLLTALALIRSGLDPHNAIKQIRERRSPWALSNKFFADYLLSPCTGTLLDRMIPATHHSVMSEQKLRQIASAQRGFFRTDQALGRQHDH